jgi:hypothetical protein
MHPAQETRVYQKSESQSVLSIVAACCLKSYGMMAMEFFHLITVAVIAYDLYLR